MANQVEIANKAIERCRANAIASLSEQSREAEVVTRFWNSSVDEALVDVSPKWARRTVLLNRLDEENDLWEYVYAWPNDCLDPLSILNVASTAAENRIEFQPALSSDGDKRVLLTNQEEAKLEYTARVVNCGLFDPFFADALAWKLAADIIIPLKQDLNAQQMLLKGYIGAVGKAKARNRNKGFRQPDESCSILKARQ